MSASANQYQQWDYRGLTHTDESLETQPETPWSPP
jgi:hypothetical protein